MDIQGIQVFFLNTCNIHLNMQMKAKVQVQMQEHMRSQDKLSEAELENQRVCTGN